MLNASRDLTEQTWHLLDSPISSSMRPQHMQQHHSSVLNTHMHTVENGKHLLIGEGVALRMLATHSSKALLCDAKPLAMQ